MADNQTLAGEEPLTRFIYDKNCVSVVEKRIKIGAFLPEFEKDLQRWETSVCRTQMTSEERIWELARTQRPERTIKARADHLAQWAIDLKLICITWPVPGYPEHAILIGWPDDKPTQKEIALVLSKKSKAVFPPDAKA